MTTDPVALDAVAQARLVRSGQLSARELVAATLDAIDRLDPALNAYRVVLANRALEEADRLDRLHLVETLPLRGVPIAIKDDTDVAGEVTAWGSNAYGAPATEDAVVVARLRSAGAVIIGKTNVPELALWPWTASAAWGTTRNPWNPATTPGGSSGGSAAAVAAGMASMALGSDGGGSVRYPAALTALDTAPERLRIGVALGPPPGSGVRLTDRAAAAVDHVTDLLTSLGHQLSTVAVDYGRGALWNSTVRYLKGCQHDVEQMAHPGKLEPRTRRLARLARGIPQRSLDRARRHEPAIAGRINKSFSEIDVILTPITFDTAPQIEELPGSGVLRSLRRSTVSAWSIPWNTIGQPAASIPAGLDPDGSPRAVQLAGRPNDETTILRLAHQLQQAAPWPAPGNPLGPFTR